MDEDDLAKIASLNEGQKIEFRVSWPISISERDEFFCVPITVGFWVHAIKRHIFALVSLRPI